MLSFGFVRATSRLYGDYVSRVFQGAVPIQPADLSVDGHPLCPMVASVCFWTGLAWHSYGVVYLHHTLGGLKPCLWSIPAPILFGHDVTKDSTPES